MGEVKLFPHQQMAAEFLKTRDSYALFWGMRVGKTYPTITVLEHWHLVQMAAKKTLILMPPSAMADWIQAIFTVSPILGGYLYYGSKEQFHVWNESDEGIMLLSYGHVNNMRQSGRYLTHDMVKNIDAFILDESHNCNNLKTGNFKFAYGLSRRVKRKLLLTGTPHNGNFQGYYSQMKLLDSEIFDGFTKNEFLNGYFDQDFSGRWVINPQAKPMLHHKLRNHTSSLRIEDVAQYFPKVRNIKVNIEQSEKCKKLMERLKHDYLLQYENKEITAVNAAAELAKILQIANGHCKTDAGETIEIEESGKIRWLKDNLRSVIADSKVIIWCIYKQDHINIKRALDKMKIGYVHYKSGATPKEREKALKKFRELPDKKVFIAHNMAAGTGVNLSVADVTIVYSRSHHWIAHQQGLARNVSLEERNLTIYDLVVSGTPDEDVYHRLGQKQQNHEESMAELVMKKWARGE